MKNLTPPIPVFANKIFEIAKKYDADWRVIGKNHIQIDFPNTENEQLAKNDLEQHGYIVLIKR